MSSKFVRRAAIVVTGAALMCLAVLLMASRGRYVRRDVEAQSADVKEALGLLQSIAADPAQAGAAMSASANELARNSVVAAAASMHRAPSVDYKEAVWFGDFLRVTVEWRLPGGQTQEQHFYFRREQGKLRLTGLDR